MLFVYSVFNVKSLISMTILKFMHCVYSTLFIWCDMIIDVLFACSFQYGCTRPRGDQPGVLTFSHCTYIGSPQPDKLLYTYIATK